MIKLNKRYYTFQKDYGFIEEVETLDAPTNDDLQVRVKYINQGWTTNCEVRNLFETREEAIIARDLYDEKEVQEMIKDIYSMEDLLRFSMSANNEMPNVRTAIRRKASELGLDIEKL